MAQPQTITPPSIAAAVADATWLAHRYDPGHDAVHLLPVPRATHARTTFLTDEYLPEGPQPLVIARRDAIAAAPSPAPIHFVFHSAFCCSTLIARAMDRPGWAMGLKEPPILNDLIGWRRRGDSGPDMAEVLDDVLTLLARPFARGEAIVVKPSNIATALYAPMLALRPQAGALLLYAPLPTFLGSIARKGLDGRLWARTLLTGFLDDRLIDLGMSPRDHLGQTDLQVAAIGWLAQHALFAQLAARFGPRVRTLDSARLTAAPAPAMRAIARLFGLTLDDAALRDMLAGPAFTRHSKSDAPFGAEDRSAEDRAAQTLHADEIAKVVHWATVVAERAGIAMTLPNPLLDDAA